MNSTKQLKIGVITSQMFAENAYLAWLEGSGECLVFDPGLDAEQIVEAVREHKMEVAAILNTHGHADHIAGNQGIKSAWPDAPLIIGEGDAPKLSDPQQNLSASYGFEITSPPADQLVRHGESIEIAGIAMDVRELPGHSSGHVVFICKWHQPVIVFAGDVLFAGGIGRTDFPDGSMEQLAHSIRSQLYCLPDDTVVLPGHGPPTTVGEEKRSNPFVPGE